MTRTFSKSTAHSQFKLTALCAAIALGWIVHGAPTLAEDVVIGTIEVSDFHMASIC